MLTICWFSPPCSRTYGKSRKPSAQVLTYYLSQLPSSNFRLLTSHLNLSSHNSQNSTFDGRGSSENPYPFLFAPCAKNEIFRHFLDARRAPLRSLIEILRLDLSSLTNSSSSGTCFIVMEQVLSDLQKRRYDGKVFWFPLLQKRWVIHSLDSFPYFSLSKSETNEIPSLLFPKASLLFSGE